MIEVQKSAAARPVRDYMNPYAAGVGIGLCLLAAFVLMGRGLGASGGFSVLAAVGVERVDADHARANPFFSDYLGEDGANPLNDWIIFELIGVTAGAALSGLLSGRARLEVERGPGISDRGRMAYAFGGGIIMGVGAKFARGCTSGQAITGGALLSVGSWLFIAGAFGAGYAAAFLFRRQWL